MVNVTIYIEAPWIRHGEGTIQTFELDHIDEPLFLMKSCAIKVSIAWGAMRT